MKVIVQRVLSASVEVEQQVVGSIDQGLLLLIGLAEGDTDQELIWMANKILGLRIFERNGLLQDSVLDIDGELLAVSQFTLLADCNKGKRPSFSKAMKPDKALPMFNTFVQLLEEKRGSNIQTGIFGADMKVSSINNGPVTIILER